MWFSIMVCRPMFLQLIGKKKKLYKNVYNNVNILYGDLNNLLLYGTLKEKNVIWIGHNISLL